MRFIDRVSIRVESGAGGDGCASFRREAHVPKGGPDGGDGGRGGDVVIRTDHHLSTLIDFHYHRRYKAERGVHGQGSRKKGRAGEGVVLRVPPGTVVLDAATGEVLADLLTGEFTVAEGGAGGRGNARFATATRQSPDFAEPGRKGREREVVLELRLIADVGVVGLPNAGKSTLVSRVSAARPKIADYPFTTLTPNLGVVRLGDDGSFVIADVPGLVEGAHMGVGLGHRFLRHVERTTVLIHLVGLSPADGDALEAYRTVSRELAAYGGGLAGKIRLVALNKAELVQPEERRGLVERFRAETGGEPHLVSCASGEGLGGLIGAAASALAEARRQEADQRERA
jgi:GTP-binding protein